MTETNYPIDETLVEQFESRRQQDPSSELASYLPPEEAPTYLGTLLELVLVDLEFAWRFHGQTADESAASPAENISKIGDYLQRFPKLQDPQLIRQLVKQEFYVRCQYATPPEAEEYCQRFPQAIRGPEDLPLELLPSHNTSALELQPGAMVDNYKLLQVLGEGGFGVVFMAEQQHPVRRMVALKVIKAGMDTREVIARFEAERQALALMDHENVARVFDAGATETGRPYFVMELVKGVTITEYCDHNRLSPRDRLKLFASVCRAIQHAHQKGIIHRDIKPSNVLIALYDGKPVPKVIDFGVAKAIQQRLTEKTMFTKYGQVMGTPQYMSPEQAELNQLDVDTRSDVYSLGVLLYELLTGSTPLKLEELRDVAFHEMLRMIRESEAPRPSTRVSETGEALASISAQRQTEPDKLGRFVKGDLDWIVMKAVEKERSRRYDSPISLADDIDRFLNHEPVEAGPPTASYRLRKFAMKHRGWLTVAATIAGVLLVASIVSIWSAIEANRQRDLAQTAQKQAEESNSQTQQALKETQAAKEETEQALNSMRLQNYIANIGRVNLALANSNRQVAESALLQCPEQHRGLEWNLLYHQVFGEELTFQEHQGPVRRAVFSPDGHWVASTARREQGPAELFIWKCQYRRNQAPSDRPPCSD